MTIVLPTYLFLEEMLGLSVMYYIEAEYLHTYHDPSYLVGYLRPRDQCGKAQWHLGL